MPWSRSPGLRKRPHVRPPVTADERRLIAEAIAAGRVTVCPPSAAPEIGSSLFGHRDAVEAANELLRVERSA